MAEDRMDLIVAAYPGDLQAAQRGFDSLVAAVKGRRVGTEGAILVERDTEGNVKVTQTGDHLGRKGATWGAGVGLVVGLFSPPMVGAVAVGAAAGACVGRFAKHREDSGIAQHIGEKLPVGGAAIITVVDDDDRLAAEQALGGSLAKSVVPMDKGSISELKSALA